MIGQNGLVSHAPNVAGLLNSYAGKGRALEDRARGVLLGLAAGNLLGLPVEGLPAKDIARLFPAGVTEIDPAELHRDLDDDLAQAAELAEALVSGGDYVAELAQRLVRWRRENGRGIGHTTTAVIDLLEGGHAPPEAGRIIYEEMGRIAPNGGIMRCAPVALFRHSDPVGLVRDSAATCVVTHFAPACQWSCILLNAAISLLVRDVEPPVDELVAAALADGAPAELGERAEQVGSEGSLPALDEGHIGHTLLCLQAGLWALGTSLEFEPAMVEVVNAGGDTDTNGAVAGAVLGARYGVQGIPGRWLDCIPQRMRLEGLADELLAGGE